MVQITFVSSLKKVCSHKFLIFCVKNRYVLLYRLQGVKLGLKSVIFLCRIYLSMYFSPKNVFFYLLNFFILTHEFNMPFVCHRGTKTQMAVIQRHYISIRKELFIKTYKMFLVQAFSFFFINRLL